MLIAFINSFRLTVGSLIKLLKSTLVPIKFKIDTEFVSILDYRFDSSANSYKAKEYLLAEVLEKPLFLLNLIPLNVSD